MAVLIHIIHIWSVLCHDAAARDTLCATVVGSRMFLMWCAGTVLTIYLIDSFILARFRMQTVSTGKRVAVAMQCS